MPDNTTGARSGNSATSDRFPPIALSVFRSVDSSRSLRFSKARNAVLSDAERLCHTDLCEFAGAPQLTQGHFLSDQFARASLNLPALS